MALLPLGAMLLAGSVGAMAQTAGTDTGNTLSTVTVKEVAEAPEGKDSIRATETTIGQGKQLLRNIPQSVTVVTEKLMEMADKHAGGRIVSLLEGGYDLDALARSTGVHIRALMQASS